MLEGKLHDMCIMDHGQSVESEKYILCVRMLKWALATPPSISAHYMYSTLEPFCTFDFDRNLTKYLVQAVNWKICLLSNPEHQVQFTCKMQIISSKKLVFIVSLNIKPKKNLCCPLGSKNQEGWLVANLFFFFFVI